MGALPKKKLTTTRQKTRLAHKYIKEPRLPTCPQCQNLKRSHHVCPHCGFYKGREIISLAKDTRA